MSAFDGLLCFCGETVGKDQMILTLENSDEGYPILADDGFWEYLYICKCGRQYLRPMIGDDYSSGI
jgi:hypothetical protein